MSFFRSLRLVGYRALRNMLCSFFFYITYLINYSEYVNIFSFLLSTVSLLGRLRTLPRHAFLPEYPFRDPQTLS